VLSQITNLVLGSTIGRAAIFFLLAFWAAVVYWTWRDAASRSEQSWVAPLSALLVLLLNVPGLIIYMIVRPPNTLLELEAMTLEAEALEASHPEELACPKCRRPVESEFILCPYCRTPFGHICPRCSRRLEGAWAVCPYCGEESVNPPSLRTAPVPRDLRPGAEPLPPRADRVEMPQRMRRSER
jgi:RNA polymerase subunit RPABC4/transcription elongation factor Spt4